jgi:hypothetical protein
MKRVFNVVFVNESGGYRINESVKKSTITYIGGETEIKSK